MDYISADSIGRRDWIKCCNAAAGELQFLRSVSLNVLLSLLTAAAIAIVSVLTAVITVTVSTVAVRIFLVIGVVTLATATGTTGECNHCCYPASCFEKATPCPFVTIRHSCHQVTSGMYKIFVSV